MLLARGLRSRGHQQLIVCTEGAQLEAEARREGLPVFALPAHDPLHAHGIVQLRQHLLVGPADIIHAHDGKSQTIAWLASLGMPVRRVASRLVTFLPKGLAGGRLIHRLKYRYTCDCIITISEFVKRLLVDAGVPADKIEAVLAGIAWPVDVPSSETRSEVRALWGFGEAEFVVGHIGAFAPEKGQDIAVEAAILLADRLPDMRVVLAGEASTKTLQRLGPQLRAAGDRVRLLGYVEDLWRFLAGLDLYVMPSRAEGLGASVLQAMACGLPVVASRVGGLPELVVPGATGWLVPSESPEALAKAIADAASDGERLREFGRRGRERASHFSAEAMIDKTEAVYARLLGFDLPTHGAASRAGAAFLEMKRTNRFRHSG